MAGLTRFKSHNDEKIKLNKQKGIGTDVETQRVADKLDDRNIEYLVDDGRQKDKQQDQRFSEVIADVPAGMEIIKDMCQELKDVKPMLMAMIALTTDVESRVLGNP